MNTQKTVLNKIAQLSKIQEVELASKQELDSEKVELAIDDYAIADKELLRIYDEIKNQAGELASYKTKIESIRRQVTKLSLTASNILSNAEKTAISDVQKAKELGVDASVVNKAFQSVKNSESTIQKMVNNILQSTKSLS